MQVLKHRDGIMNKMRFTDNQRESWKSSGQIFSRHLRVQRDQDFVENADIIIVKFTE